MIIDRFGQSNHDVFSPNKNITYISDGGSVSRTGRVRKKSSKILEMEQGIDDLEEVLTGRKVGFTVEEFIGHLYLTCVSGWFSKITSYFMGLCLYFSWPSFCEI
jgi:hypothetical protein